MHHHRVDVVGGRLSGERDTAISRSRFDGGHCIDFNVMTMKGLSHHVHSRGISNISGERREFANDVVLYI